MSKLVETVRTPIAIHEYVRAVLDAWHVVNDGVPLKACLGVLWAQYMIETGGRACWNYNVGNAKHVAGDGFDWVALKDVWEGYSPADAAKVIAQGRAIRDPQANRQAAVGKGRVAIRFNQGEPETLFRAYDSLSHAMRSHLQFLKRRYGPAWQLALAGDPVGFANALKAKGYYTASATAYAAGMRRAFDPFMRATAFEVAMTAAVAEGTMAAPEAASPSKDDETPPPVAVRTTPGLGPEIVRPNVPFPERDYSEGPGNDDDDEPDTPPEGAA